MKKENTLKISICILGVIAIFFVIGITYAYFGISRQSEEENTFSSSCFNIELQANNILSEGNIPMTDEEAKKITPYTFTIKNACTASAEVGVNLDILKTSSANLSNYKISLNNAITLEPTPVGSLENDEITENDTLLTKKLGNVYIKENSEKTIELRLWMKDSVGVGEGENEIIESKISLSATAIPTELNSVQEKIIADNGGILKIRGKKAVDLTTFSPIILYQENPIVEDNTKSSVRSDLERKYASSYTFNPEGGVYTLNSPVSEPLNENHIGMYTCKSTADSCSTMYKVKAVEINPIQEGYSLSTPTEKSWDVTSTLDGNMTFGKSYHFNSRGQFVLDDIVTNATFTSEYTGYYVCGTSTAIRGTSTTCTYLHEIVEVETDPGEGKYYSEEYPDTEWSYSVEDFGEESVMASTNYDFNSETGIYTLINPVSISSFTSDHIGYYTCGVNSSSCEFVIGKIKTVQDNRIELVDELDALDRFHHLKKTKTYSKVTNYSYITLADKYTSVQYDYSRNNTGLFLGEDDFGDTYYFRGGNDKNNIFFAGYYWNIIRINGDGSLRVIYRGATPDAVGIGTKIEQYAFNGDGSYNINVGFMYGSYYADTYEGTHANINNSRIKDQLDKWYENNLLNFDNYLADSIFCNDRSLYSGSGYRNISSYYNGYNRIRNTNDLMPDLKCSQKNDRFTVSNSYGNQALKYPIGLLTTDEAGVAGLYNTSASTYNYLNTGIEYWTMTPSRFSSSAYINFITSTGAIGEKVANSSLGIRPVINLKGNVILSGTGTLEDPYRVEGLQTE